MEGAFRPQNERKAKDNGSLFPHFTSLYVQRRLTKKFHISTILIETRMARFPPICAMVSEDSDRPFKKPSDIWLRMPVKGVVNKPTTTARISSPTIFTAKNCTNCRQTLYERESG